MADGSTAPQEDRSPKCPECGKVFKNYKGRRVHQRSAHKEAYHEALAQTTRARPKQRWDPEEEAVMADFERNHPNLGRLMNQQIHEHVLPHRSLEAIKCHRKAPGYRALLARGVPEPRAPTVTKEGYDR